MSLLKKIGSDAALGRHVVAAQEIKHGKKILSERFLISVQNPMKPVEFAAIQNRPDKLKSIWELQSEIGVKSWRSRMGTVMNSVMRVITPELRAVPNADLTKFSQILMVNAFGGKETPFNLVSKASMLSHSCRPNCTIENTDVGLNIVSINDIDADEALCISYLPIMQLLYPTHMRQFLLADTKFFVCQCPRCTEKMDTGRTFGCACCASTGTEGTVYPLAVTDASTGAVKMSEWSEKRISSFLYRAATDIFSPVDPLRAGKETFHCATCGKEGGCDSLVHGGTGVVQMEADLAVEVRNLELIIALKRAPTTDEHKARVHRLCAAVNDLASRKMILPSHWLVAASAYLRLLVSTKCELNAEALKQARAQGLIDAEGALPSDEAQKQAEELVKARVIADAHAISQHLQSHANIDSLHLARVFANEIKDPIVLRTAIDAIQPANGRSPVELAAEEVARLVAEEGMTEDEAAKKVMADMIGANPQGKIVDGEIDASHLKKKFKKATAAKLEF